MIVGPGHILARLTPDKALFKSHPEYFPFLGGQRKSTYSDVWGGATAFCYSNPEAMRLVIANALKYLDSAPFIDVFALYPPDGSQHGVQCHVRELRETHRERLVSHHHEQSRPRARIASARAEADVDFLQTNAVCRRSASNRTPTEKTSCCSGATISGFITPRWILR